ncbi:hypothetical protein [Streptomyces paludis]|uniref:hypothetical protein n=1 Tax=Streptomyces paludis TaxID=2282738 RepID=UPI0013B46EEE|nr:hypothetical protein [Streptomyces paludis]
MSKAMVSMRMVVCRCHVHHLRTSCSFNPAAAGGNIIETGADFYRLATTCARAEQQVAAG